MYRNKLKHFLGVFSHDTLPQQTLHTGDSLVINYNNQDEPGSHWICVFIGDEYPEVFDSFGVVPSKIIQEWLKKHTGSKHISYSSHQIQNKWSTMCGWYCIHYIMERTKGISQYDVIHNFEMNDTKTNEKILKKYIE